MFFYLMAGGAFAGLVLALFVGPELPRWRLKWRKRRAHRRRKGAEGK